MTVSEPPVVLVWPDRGQSEREVRAVLPDGSQTLLLVARWDPDAPDGGRNALLMSVRDARQMVSDGGGEPNSLSVVGFGCGAVAAAGLSTHAKRLGIGLGRVICVAPQWNEPDPFSGSPLAEVPERVELVPDAASVAASW